MKPSTKNVPLAYIIKRINGLYCVVTEMNQTLVHFKATERKNCKDFILTRSELDDPDFVP